MTDKPTPSELPAVKIHCPWVEVSPAKLSGSPLVAGSPVPVRRLWAWHRKGVTVETLVKRYPSLGPAKVLGALAFAWENQDLMAADLAREAAMLGGAEVAMPSPVAAQEVFPGRQPGEQGTPLKGGDFDGDCG